MQYSQQYSAYPQNDPIWIFVHFALLSQFRLQSPSFICNRKQHNPHFRRTIFEWVSWIRQTRRSLKNFHVQNEKVNSLILLNSKHKYSDPNYRVSDMWPNNAEQWSKGNFSSFSASLFLFSFISIIIVSHFRLFNIIIAYKIDNNNNRIIQTHLHADARTDIRLFSWNIALYGIFK